MATERISGKRAKRIVMGLIRRMTALLLGIATTACAHTSSGTLPPPSKQPAATSTTGTFRPYTLAEYPELTPEEVGGRFLRLIDSLESLDELSSDRVREIMQLPMVDTPETHGGFLTMSLPESGWQYSFSYRIDPKYARYTNAKLEFHGKKDNRAGMAPVCGMDFNAYMGELRKIGFVEREDLAQYESPMPLSIYDPVTGQELGFEDRRSFRLPGYSFTRNDVGVLIIERPEANAPDTKLQRFCVQSISVGRGA
ncbi:MAG TPA: hypothetical protein VEY92_08920 [Pseudoxanthomonas sp.]|nr:hypothetical protein [Pseudoxanthomonas sp.]